MGYYDRVKDSIREENSSEEENDSSGAGTSDSSAPSGNFDTLREAAENTEVEDEEEGDDTPIEVLEEDGLSEQAPGRQREKRDREGQAPERNGGRERSSEPQESSGSREISGDTSDIEDKLDRIIEQNARMIEILEGFGN